MINNNNLETFFSIFEKRTKGSAYLPELPIICPEVNDFLTRIAATLSEIEP